MYGTPHVEFSLSARVIDEAGNPIQGIEVRTKSGQPFDHNTGIADYLGNIEAVSGDMWPGEQYEVVFLDVDGEYNGGEFENLSLDISDKVKQTKRGDGDWYQGTYKAELGDVTLTLKEQNAEDENSKEENNTNEEE
jgi:putative lipoprotein (rSAM/lipoprotein system)